MGSGYEVPGRQGWKMWCVGEKKGGVYSSQFFASARLTVRRPNGLAHFGLDKKFNVGRRVPCLQDYCTIKMQKKPTALRCHPKLDDCHF